MAALLPSDMNGEDSGKVTEGVGSGAVKRGAQEQRKARSDD
jgi:hypothetical protein